ncbi:hypothetical protein [Neobacillus niacini]|nr:hypothetical protein [Neobacillus niacini]MCM3763888.1 hypothetical protein [Neobacillus niacini]
MNRFRMVPILALQMPGSIKFEANIGLKSDHGDGSTAIDSDRITGDFPIK